MIRPYNQVGYILLPVIVVIVLVAAIALMMNTESALESNTAGSELEARQAQYVAEAGMNHALWLNRQQGCGPYGNLTDEPLGNDKYTTNLTTDLGTTTSYSIPVDQDNWIRSDNTGNSNPTDSKLHIKFDAGNIERPVYRYDLSSLAAQASILSATAWFFVSNEHPAGPVEIHALNADWTEASATWDLLGDAMDPVILAAIPAQPVKDVWVAVNLTGQVQAWVNGQPNYGIAMNPIGEGDHGDYASRESANVPYLEVIVGSPPSSPASLKAVGALANGVMRTITRNDVVLYQNPPGMLHLQPDAVDGEDAEIWDQAPNNNYGAAAETWVSSAVNDTTRSLLRFNTGAIPAGARILEANLFLERQSGSGADQPVSAHRITNPWSEGSVTWNRRQTGTNWDTAGGDFDNTAVTTTPVGPVNQRYAWNITPLVQGWVDGIYPNYGVALIAATAGMPGERFYTSDHADPSRWPSLSITYACDCGEVCVAPQGSGKIVMIGDWVGFAPDPRDREKEAIIESWGYDVDIYDDNFIWTITFSNYDLVYVSETASSAAVTGQLGWRSIGIVNEQGNLNGDLGLTTGMSTTIGDSIDITDNSHYITAPFALGALPIYGAEMEILTATGTRAADLQILAEAKGIDSLVLLETGATSLGGPAAGRRVTLPLGRTTNSNFNWSYLNQNGRLIVQRALTWGAGLEAGKVNSELLLVVVDPSSLTAQEDDKKTLIESWGYNVNLIDESDTQAEFDTAVAANDVVYITEDVGSGNVNAKLVNATIGVVTEEDNLSDEFGFSDSIHWGTGTALTIDNTHYITSPLPSGSVTILTTTESLADLTGTLAPDIQIIGQSTDGPALATIDAGASLILGGSAQGRRVILPWGGNDFDVNHLNDEGLTILRRSLEWGTGVGCGSTQPLLLVVGNAATLSSKDDGMKTLMESWCYRVTVIDDGDSQANFDAAAAAADVVYVSGTTSGPSLADKLTGSPTPIVNEISGKLDNFGFSSSTASSVNESAFIATNATHYISQTFAGNPVTFFTTDLAMPVPGGTLAPGLQIVGETTGSTPTLVTLDIGAERWDSNPAPARRAHLPFTNAETNQLTEDGETLMQRALEWATSSNTGPIAHWKLDDGAGPIAIDSVGGHHGTLTNPPAWVAGTLGDALDFDGSNDYVDLTSDAELDDVFVGGATVMAWINPAGWGENGYGRIFDKSSSPSATGDGWVIRMNTDNGGIINFGQGFTGGRGWWRIPNASISLGAWQHIAIAYDASSTGNDPIIYLDGIPLLVTEVDTPSGTLRSDAAINLRLGNYAGGTTHTFNGIIDDARIYDRMLSAAEIADLVTGSGSGGDCDVDTVGTYIEAENYSGTIAGINGLFSVESSTAGYNGSGYLRNNGGDTFTPPRTEGRTYDLNFTETGTYNLWIRGYSLDGLSDTDFVGFEGTEFGQYTTNGIYNQWLWSDSVRTGGANQFNVATTGVHTINVWVREQDMLLDGIYITKGSETPSGGVPSGATIVNPGSCGDGGGGPTVFEASVANGSDDAEERVSNGNVNNNSSDLELVTDGSNNQLVGMRFTSVTIPNGSTISSAYIQFQVDETNSGATSVNIQGQAIDDAPTFTTGNNNISSRSRTSSTVPWAPVPWTTVGEAGTDQQTPNIATVIQEIIDRPGWASGNDLVIIMTGSGERTAESYNGDSSGAALLHIEY